jgi:hypothetical protein
MNKFNKLVKALEDCSDTTMKDNAGIVTERGIAISDGTCITYGYGDKLIHLYSGCREILSFGKDSPLLDMFSEISNIINESEEDIKVSKKYKTQSEEIQEERTTNVMVYETLGFRFIKDEEFPWIEVYRVGKKDITFLEEFEPEETIVEFTVLKIVAMNWIHDNVEIELRG